MINKRRRIKPSSRTTIIQNNNLKFRMHNKRSKRSISIGGSNCLRTGTTVAALKTVAAARKTIAAVSLATLAAGLILSCCLVSCYEDDYELRAAAAASAAQQQQEAAAAAAAASQCENLLRIPNSDSVICVPYQNNNNDDDDASERDQKAAAASEERRSKTREAANSIENLLNSIAEFRLFNQQQQQHRNRQHIDNLQAAQDVILQDQQQQQQLLLQLGQSSDQRGRQTGAAATDDDDEQQQFRQQQQLNEAPPELCSGLELAGSPLAAAAGCSGHQMAADASAGAGRGGAVRPARTTTEIDANYAAGASPNGDATAAADDRNGDDDDATPPQSRKPNRRIWRATAGKRRQPDFRMSADEALRLVSSATRAQDGRPAGGSGGMGGGMGANLVSRAPIMLVKLDNEMIRAERRSEAAAAAGQLATSAAAAAAAAGFWQARRVGRLRAAAAGALRAHRSGLNSNNQTTPTTTTGGLLELALADSSKGGAGGANSPGEQQVAVDEDGGKPSSERHHQQPQQQQQLQPEPLLECGKRKFTFRATKSDGLGNKCWGLVNATVCFGACDTGEIADWLFPHKKSIHKVCGHGARVRREAELADCSSDSVEPSLRRYHFVDALNCVCQRCQSTDTTCLGSLSRPELPAEPVEPELSADGGSIY